MMSTGSNEKSTNAADTRLDVKQICKIIYLQHSTQYHAIIPKYVIAFTIQLYIYTHITIVYHRISGVMVSAFTSSVVDRGFEYRSGRTQDH